MGDQSWKELQLLVNKPKYLQRELIVAKIVSEQQKKQAIFEEVTRHY